MARLAVALDTTSVQTAQTWAAAVAASAAVLKIGLEFFLRHGLSGVTAVRSEAPNAELFLDLKLHDIPATVAGGCRAVAGCDPAYLTVHAAGGRQMIAAAVEALPRTRIAAVTVLTSLDTDSLTALGLPSSAQTVPRWAQLAVDAGAAALVSSAHEVASLRPIVGGDVHLITPGIRPAGSAADDQQRVATPQSAVAAGSDLLVVGRPITAAPDPGAVAASIAATLA